MRFCGYGAGRLGAELMVGGMGKLHGLVSLVFRRLRSPASLLARFSLRTLLRAKPLIAASLARLLRVSVGEEGLELWRYWEGRE